MGVHYLTLTTLVSTLNLFPKGKCTDKKDKGELFAVCSKIRQVENDSCRFVWLCPSYCNGMAPSFCPTTVHRRSV